MRCDPIDIFVVGVALIGLVVLSHLNPSTPALSVQHGVPQLFKLYTAAEFRRVIHQVLQPGG